MSGFAVGDGLESSYVMGRTIHDSRYRLLKAEPCLAEGSCSHKHPNNLDRRELEDRDAAIILEDKADQQRDHKPDVRCKNMEDELLDVIKDAPPLFHRIKNRRKVVVRQNNVGRLLRNVRAGSHRDANIRALQARAVIHTVSRHGDVAVPPVQRVDHAYLCAWGAPRYDQGKLRQGVDLRVGQRVEGVRGHYHRLEDVGGKHFALLGPGENASIDGDGARRLGVVAR